MRRVFKYLNYRLKAKTKHGVSSPFVFELLTKVFPARVYNQKLDQVEDIRRELLSSKQIITIKDLGAGSRVNNSWQRKVASIAKHSAKSPAQAQLLYRIVEFLKPANMLELGTSFGLTTIYAATANPDGRITTIEGCPETAKIARETFVRLSMKHIDLVEGNFDEVLPKLLTQFTEHRIPRSGVDYVFFDGNHRKEPTLKYFVQCLPYINNETVFVFDDIHWSKEMDEAWEEIKKHPQVRLTIDIFHMGFVFFRQEQTKEHFIVKF